MRHRRNENVWVRPERRCFFPAHHTEAGATLRKAGRVARAAMVLGMKLTRTALDEGIRILEHPDHPDAEPPADRVQKIDIR